MSTPLPYRTLPLFSILLCVILIGWGVISGGMFFDGLVYASVANNLANGNGTFWDLTYTATLHHAYYEQPPFGIFLQSLFFRILGDGLYVERIYILVMALGMIICIRKIWLEFSDDDMHMSWWPILLWIITPIVSWTYQNNLIEIPMGLFAAIAVYCLLRGCKENQWMWFIAGGLFSFLASFTKGIQGLFPLVVPILYGLVYRQNSLDKILLRSMLVMAVPGIMYVSFYFWPEANEFYQLYFQRRLAGTFAGIQDTTQSRLYVLLKLGEQLIVPTLIISAIWLIHKRVKIVFDKKLFVLFILIGCSASLPLMVTLEQRPFYLSTSIPYFAIALALFSKILVQEFFEKIINNTTHLKFLQKSLPVILLLAILALPLIYQFPKRDLAIIHDLQVLKKEIRENTTIQVSESTLQRWNYHAYFMRYGKISLDAYGKHEFYLARENEIHPADSCFEKIKLPIRNMILFKCEN